MAFVSAYCSIRNNRVALNGKEILSGENQTSDEFLLFAYEEFKVDYPKFYKMDTLSKAGFLAAEILLKEQNIKVYGPFDVAVVLSNSNSSLDTDIRYAEASKNVPSPAMFVYTLPNIVTGEICIRHGIKGENSFFITEKFDANLLIQYVDVLFASGHTNASICGWVDVVDRQLDVLLYLTEKKPGRLALLHTSEQLNLLYQ